MQAEPDVNMRQLACIHAQGSAQGLPHLAYQPCRCRNPLTCELTDCTGRVLHRCVVRQSSVVQLCRVVSFECGHCHKPFLWCLAGSCLAFAYFLQLAVFEGVLGMHCILMLTAAACCTAGHQTLDCPGPGAASAGSGSWSNEEGNTAQGSNDRLQAGLVQ